MLLTVDLSRLRKEMEVELAKKDREMEGLNQKMGQEERDSQLALKQREQAHEEDLDRMQREKVNPTPTSPPPKKNS